MPTKELAIPFKHTFFIEFDKDENTLIQTYKDEIERLERIIEEKNKSIRKLKDALNSLSDKTEYIAHLEYFRNKLLFECPYKNFQQITILQCISIIEKGECKQTRCKARLKHLAKFIFE